jgi:hypothetical protein
MAANDQDDIQQYLLESVDKSVCYWIGTEVFLSTDK